MFSNIRKITKECLTKADVQALRDKYAGMDNVQVRTRPAGKELGRMHADIIITGTLAEQLTTIKLMRAI